MLLEGLFLPLTTPYLTDGRLNLNRLHENVSRYAKTPAAGLVALSRSGHPTLLSDEETREVLRCVADAAVAEKVLVAGIARDSVLEALRLIEFAAHSGYDAALVPLPSLLRGGSASREAITYFQTLADSSALPLMLDSGPDNVQIPAQVVVELARHANIIGIVDAIADSGRVGDLREATAGIRREVTVTSVFAAVTGRMIAKHRPASDALLSAASLSGGGAAVAIAAPAVATTLKTRTKAVGFQILCGRATGMLEALSAGASGAAPALAACAPQACYEVIAAWKDGDPALAAEKQDRLRIAAEVVEEGLGVAGIKYGCDLNGYFGGRPRLPILPLSSEERRQVESIMAGIRN
jgi:dihydrodipicolinate synthase/N-acetylneuraminate lyase